MQYFNVSAILSVAGELSIIFFWMLNCSSVSGDCDFLRRLWNSFHSSQQQRSASSSQAVCGWIWWRDGVLALKCFTSCLLVHSHYITLPFDQDWTKVITIALYAELLFTLFLPLGWQTALVPFCRNVLQEHVNSFQNSRFRSFEKYEITTSVLLFKFLYVYIKTI